MAKEEFNLGGIIALKFRHAVTYGEKFETRELIRKSAMSVLEATCKPGEEISEEKFLSAVSDKSYHLTDNQKHLVAQICFAAASSYQDWREENESEKKRIKELRASMPIPEIEQAPQASNIELVARAAKSSLLSLHGGSGYTGRLSVGRSAPHGSESHNFADQPNMGIEGWIKAVTAGGFGAGYSYAELASTRQPKTYEEVMPTATLNIAIPETLLGYIDKATNPGNFVRATLAYYRKPMVIDYGNIRDINTANINNPENIRTMLAMDGIYRYMRDIDNHNILTPKRAARFLVMADDLLSEVKIKQPRRESSIAYYSYKEKRRDLEATVETIESSMNSMCGVSGISRSEMLKNISADKRAHLREPKPFKFEGPTFKKD